MSGEGASASVSASASASAVESVEGNGKDRVVVLLASYEVREASLISIYWDGCLTHAVAVAVAASAPAPACCLLPTASAVLLVVRLGAEYMSGPSQIQAPSKVPGCKSITAIVTRTA